MKINISTPVWFANAAALSPLLAVFWPLGPTFDTSKTMLACNEIACHFYLDD